MLQMDFAFFSVEIVCGFTSTFVAVCYDNSKTFEFPPRIKWKTLVILKFLFAALRGKYKKFHEYKCTNIVHWQDIMN